MEQQNKVAFITGSSRGIGKACAFEFAQRGYDVILHCGHAIDLAKQTAKTWSQPHSFAIRQSSGQAKPTA